MELAVVIPALDEAGCIAEAVAGAAAAGVEVLVVDGGSRDGTADEARAAGAIVVASPPGRARQLGVGFEATRGDVVLFLHADSILPAGWPEAVRGVLADPAVVGGYFDLRFDERSWPLRLVEWGARLRVMLFGLPYGDQALFARRAVIESLGGVPSAPFMEDLDLVRALWRRGKLARVRLPVRTSARRYREAGTLRVLLRNQVAAAGWWLGVDRARLLEWYRR